MSERDATLITRVSEREATLITGVSEREATFITLHEEWVNTRRTALIQSPRGGLHFYGGRFHRNQGNVSIVLLSVKEFFT